MRKLLAVIAAIAISITYLTSVDVCASSYSPNEKLAIDYKKLSEEMDYFRVVKGKLGTPFYTYEYQNGTCEKTSHIWYPVVENDNIICFVLQNTEDPSDLQITDCYTSVLNKFYLDKTAIALIYDAHSCYVASNNSLTKISDFNYLVKDRDLIENPKTFMGANSQSIKLHIPGENLSPIERYDAHHFHNNFIKRSSEANLLLPFVSQNPPSNICWAASVTCIGKYLTSKPYTAKDIAQSVYGNSWNQSASISTAMSALKTKYNISYTKTAYTAPSDTRILTNIRAGYPVYSTWKWKNGSHATVIRGIKTGNYIYVMDPEYGYNIANKSSNIYSYISGYSGVKLTLSGYGAKY